MLLYNTATPTSVRMTKTNNDELTFSMRENELNDLQCTDRTQSQQLQQKTGKAPLKTNQMRDLASVSNDRLIE